MWSYLASMIFRERLVHGSSDKVNTTRSSSIKSKQFVYRREHFKDSYVYLDNDVVRINRRQTEVKAP